MLQTLIKEKKLQVIWWRSFKLSRKLRIILECDMISTELKAQNKMQRIFMCKMCISNIWAQISVINIWYFKIRISCDLNFVNLKTKWLRIVFLCIHKEHIYTISTYFRRRKRKYFLYIQTFIYCSFRSFLKYLIKCIFIVCIGCFTSC